MGRDSKFSVSAVKTVLKATAGLALTAFSRAPFELEACEPILLTRFHIFRRWCCSVFFGPEEDSIYPENLMASRVLHG